jgi:hypothetical protein
MSDSYSVASVIAEAARAGVPSDVVRDVGRSTPLVHQPKSWNSAVPRSLGHHFCSRVSETIRSHDRRLTSVALPGRDYRAISIPSFGLRKMPATRIVGRV